MARITTESIERVREAADIVEVISAHTDLRRAGARFTGLCPFHEERTPSFSVDPGEKLYYCFGCEAGGDVFKFVCEKEGLDFPDAIEALADRFGVELEREEADPRAEEARKRRARLAEAVERAAGFYASFLWESEKAAKARDYLLGRGLSEEILREFGVGFAPSAWDTLLVRGQAAGFTIPELLGAGLVQKGQKGGFYDRFRARITFPIRDHRGRALGFGARATGSGSKPKYLNSAEGELYRKSHTLFGIERARSAMARGGRAVVVEGYTDVLALHQAGVSEAVAVMGTAITPEQISMLARNCEEVVLALDADSAGRDAMLRAQRVAGGKRLRLRVARMPEGEDPADMLAGGEIGGFRELVDEAEEMSVFHVHSILAEADLGSPAGRDLALDEAVPVLVEMGETISRDELVREVAGHLDADPALVAGRVRAGRSGGGERREQASEPAPGPPPGKAAVSPRVRREQALLAMAVAAPEQGKGYLERLSAEHFADPLTARAFGWLQSHLEDPLEGLARDDTELVSLVARLKMSADKGNVEPEALELNYLELERGLLDDQIASARAEGDDERFIALTRRRADVAGRIAGRLDGA